MIWYFLAGMIAGAVGMLKLLDWYVGKLLKNKMTTEEETDDECSDGDPGHLDRDL